MKYFRIQFLVNFDQYKENGFELFLCFFTNTTDWGKNLSSEPSYSRNLGREEVAIALPTQKLLVDTNDSETLLRQKM